jgi:hypothetical protein
MSPFGKFLLASQYCQLCCTQPSSTTYLPVTILLLKPLIQVITWHYLKCSYHYEGVCVLMFGLWIMSEEPVLLPIIILFKMPESLWRLPSARFCGTSFCTHKHSASSCRMSWYATLVHFGDFISVHGKDLSDKDMVSLLWVTAVVYLHRTSSSDCQPSLRWAKHSDKWFFHHKLLWWCALVKMSSPVVNKTYKVLPSDFDILVSSVFKAKVFYNLTGCGVFLLSVH